MAPTLFDLFDRIWDFTIAFLWNWKGIVAGACFAMLTLPQLLSSSRRETLDRWISPEHRRAILVAVAFASIFVASFQAYNDIGTKLRATQQDVRALRSKLDTLESKATDTRKQQTIRAQLQQFYSRGQELKNRAVTAENFSQWMGETNEFANIAATWIEQNIGPAARARFLDMSGPSYTFGTGLNPEHQNALNWLTKTGDNLKVLIERLEAYTANP
jgi:hypothetical protein